MLRRILMLFVLTAASALTQNAPAKAVLIKAGGLLDVEAALT